MRPAPVRPRAPLSKPRRAQARSICHRPSARQLWTLALGAAGAVLGAVARPLGGGLGAPLAGGADALAPWGGAGSAPAPWGLVAALPAPAPQVAARVARALDALDGYDGGAPAVQRANETSLAGSEAITALQQGWAAAAQPSATALLGNRFAGLSYQPTTRPLLAPGAVILAPLSAGDGPMVAALDLLAAQHADALQAVLRVEGDQVVATLWARVDVQSWRTFTLAVPHALPALADGSAPGAVGQGGDAAAFFAVLRQRLAAVVPTSRISLASSLDTQSLVLGHLVVRLPVAQVADAAAASGTVWVPGVAASAFGSGFRLAGTPAAGAGREYRVLAADGAVGNWTLRDVAAGLPDVAPLAPPLGGAEVSIAREELARRGALWSGPAA